MGVEEEVVVGQMSSDSARCGGESASWAENLEGRGV